MSESIALMGPAVANHLWQSTAFVAAAWALTLMLRRNQARVRYAVWLAASMKFLVPFALLIAAGNLLPHPKQVVAPAVYSAMDVVEEPFAVDAPVTMVVYTPTLRERIEAALPVALAVVWAVGAAIVLMVWARRWRAVWRMRRGAELACEGREWEILQGARFTVQGSRGLELRLSNERMEPGIFGVWQPVLLWSRALSERLDDAHIEAIVAHELIHVRRRDNLTAALHMLVEAAFWFHPAVWWMERRMVREREQACDEGVVEMGGDAEAYAESLLKTCRFCVESPLVCVAGVTGGELKHRVMEIVTGRALARMTWAKKLLLAGVAACVVGAPVMVGQAKGAQRLMLAVAKIAPKPLRAAARAMIAEEQTPASGEIAEVQAPSIPTSNASPTPDDMALGPEFEVATIRLANRDDGRHWFGIRLDSSGRYTTSAASFASLVGSAYMDGPRGSERVEIDASAPKWVKSAAFDISAKVDDAHMGGWDKLTDADRQAVVRPMLRRLLAERFHLKLTIAVRPTPVYALVQAKGGAHVKEVAAPDPVEGDPLEARAKWMRDNPDKPMPGGIMCRADGGVDRCIGHAVKIENAIGQIQGSSHSDRMVVDDTGLKGYYDFSFIQPRSNDEDAMGEIEADLGMKFESRTLPIKTYMIVSAEQPSVDGAEMTPARFVPAAMVQEKPSGSVVPAAAERFDVASIKPSGPGTREINGGYTYPGGRVECIGCTAQYLVMLAFDVQLWQIANGPDWTDMGRGTRYDLEAKPPDTSPAAKLDNPVKKTPPNAEQRLMLQALLADRFGFKFHVEKRTGDVYILSRGDKPLKLQPPSDPAGFHWAGSPEGGAVWQGSGVAGKNISMPELAARLSGFLRRPVLDQTGITGNYDFEYRTGNDEPDSDLTVGIVTSMREIGLKLTQGKGPVDTIVIDGIERPSEN